MVVVVSNGQLFPGPSKLVTSCLIKQIMCLVGDILAGTLDPHGAASMGSGSSLTRARVGSARDANAEKRGGYCMY